MLRYLLWPATFLVPVVLWYFLWLPAADPPLFVDATDELDIEFTHHPGATGSYLMPEIVGSGGALLDYDNDGDLDVYLVQAAAGGQTDGRRHNRLYRQEADGRFMDVTEESKLGDTGYGMGVAVGDINNDRHLDVYLSNFGPDSLYLNDGQGSFTNISRNAGIKGDGWSTSAVFCDYDRDGYLDIYVTRYVVYDSAHHCYSSDGSRDYCAPQAFLGQSDVLYRNNGDTTFTDASRESGIDAISAPGLGVVCQDFDRDGLMDFYVANDGEPNQLWSNQGDGRFADVGLESGAGLNFGGEAEAGMGVVAGDVDGDGDLDLFLTHLNSQTNTLYVHSDERGYMDATVQAGLAVPSRPMTGFGTAFLDFDHDGRLDIAAVNGRVSMSSDTPAAAGPSWSAYAQPNQLFRNRGEGRFEDMSEYAGPFASALGVSRGLAVGDVDNDGDLDLLVTNAAGEARLYRNEAPKKGRWLIVRVVDPALNREVHGAEVTAVMGGRSYTRIANPGYGYLSSNDPRAHFGLPASGRMERLVVRWPGGMTEDFPAVGLNRQIEVHKHTGQREP